MARFAISLSAASLSAAWRFPIGTLLVNVIGCFCAGVIAGLMWKTTQLNDDARLFLLTGVLGGFTTFSAFAVETLDVVRRGDQGMALAYAFGAVLLSLLAAWLGALTVR